MDKTEEGSRSRNLPRRLFNAPGRNSSAWPGERAFGRLNRIRLWTRCGAILQSASSIVRSRCGKTDAAAGLCLKRDAGPDFRRCWLPESCCPKKMQTKLMNPLNLRLVFSGVVGAILGLLGAATGSPIGQAQAVAGSEDGVTHLRVTSQVILPGVTRLGINLGQQDYFDSGQMMKNLLFRNPGFEGMSYRSILHCNTGSAARCVDTQQGFVWPAGFWNGASFEVLDGSAAGRRGKVLTSGPSGGGYGLGLDGGSAGSATGIGAGDWLAVQKDFPGDPAAGWWPALSGGAGLEGERKDLSPATLGRQALRIEAAGAGQSALVRSYFDTTEGLTFVRLHGRFRVSFRAKGLAGDR